jgi:DMSO/TMAO reductase YedYZ molybdopterin-dependent catalytic subunit
MRDDDKYADLFAGKPGSVLGSFRTPSADKNAATVAKEKSAREKRLPPRKLPRSRVPPGQEVVNKWPVLDLGHQPHIPLDQWELTLTGAVERPLTLNWSRFQALPQVTIDADIHCVTAWSLLNNRWGGVTTQSLIGLVQPHAKVAHVIMHSHDGYRANVSLSRFADSKSLLASNWNGDAITREHGGPARVVIPSLYFWKSPKWVRQITFLEHDVKGYWEVLGYHNEGDPWKEQRYE